MLSGFCRASFGVLFCNLVLGCRYTPYTTGPCSQWCPVSNWGVCLGVTLLIVDPRQYCVCFIRSGLTPCTLLIVLYLDHMCQCGLLVMLSSNIAAPYTYAPLRCRTSQYSRTFIPLSVSFWNDLANPVVDGVGVTGFKSRGHCFFISLSCSIPTIVFYSFSLSLLSVYRFIL